MAVGTFSHGSSPRPRLTPPAAWAATAAMASTTLQTSPLAPLAEGFAPPDRATWLAQAEKTLKGAPLATLTKRSLEGVPIEPLYEPRAPRGAPTRAETGWDIRTAVRHPDATGANEAALADLRGGADSVLLRLDPSGERGVAIGS